MANPITVENLNTGDTAWQSLVIGSVLKFIQVYADKQSLDAGQTINFYVSTFAAGTTYTMRVYRLGWYQGLGSSLKFTSATLTGVAQGYWDVNARTLNNCPTAIIDATTHNLDAGWAISTSWSVPANAVTGIYLAIFTDANGSKTATSFVVRGNATAPYVVIRPDVTDAAYNDWGGYSLYTNPSVGVKVSFNRPYAYGGGAANLFAYDFTALLWLENQGYNLSYLSTVDVHSNATQLLTYKAVLFPGHNEYWSKEMRDGVEAALAAGVSLAFLGANACYWQCRFESSNKTITCYKVGAGVPLTNDPFYGVDNTRVSCYWRIAPVSRPENTMIGIMYTAYLANASNVAWIVDAAATSSFLTGTGLVPGQSYGYDLVGYEIDKVQAGGPANVQVIGTTPVLDHAGSADTSNTTIYQAPSGAWVFASGSIGWAGSLNAYRASVQAGGTPAMIPPMQALLAKVLQAMNGPNMCSWL